MRRGIIKAEVFNHLLPDFAGTPEQFADEVEYITDEVINRCGGRFDKWLARQKEFERRVANV